jgi:hypothetical protein
MMRGSDRLDKLQGRTADCDHLVGLTPTGEPVRDRIDLGLIKQQWFSVLPASAVGVRPTA